MQNGPLLLSWAEFMRSTIVYRDYIHIPKIAVLTGTDIQVKTTKLFDRKQFRSCGGKVIPKRACLTCNSPVLLGVKTAFQSRIIYTCHIQNLTCFRTRYLEFQAVSILRLAILTILRQYLLQVADRLRWEEADWTSLPNRKDPTAAWAPGYHPKTIRSHDTKCLD